MLSNIAPLTVAACLLVSSVAVAGPNRRLYATAPGLDKIYVFGGNHIISSWAKLHPGESPIAVMDTVRTSNQGYQDPEGGGPGGAEYTLSGTPTGATYPGYWEFYDGTTDGTYNYSVNYNGNVYRFDRNWQNPEWIFGSSWGVYTTGITYDPLNNSLWISHYGGNEIENRSLTGAFLSSFNTSPPPSPWGYFSPTFLAMDYADGTLWTASRFGNLLYQYDRNGNLLSTQKFTDPATGKPFFGGSLFGGEFKFPSDQFGVPQPPLDFDVDGNTDIAVRRPDIGVWYILPSGDPGTYATQQWGLSTDIPVPGDYDGDGKTEIAVWRPDSGVWYILQSQSPGTYTATQWGLSTDIPVPAE
jgi:hypothetical protein